MTAYKVLKELTDEQRDALVQTGAMPCSSITNMMIYEYYLAMHDYYGAKWGSKLKAKEAAAVKYRVNVKTVVRAIAFCEGK
jgi:hypothetical protein